MLIIVWLGNFALSAAEIVVPQRVQPGELFVIRITPEIDKDKKIVLQNEAGKVQFMGAVQGTPDIQMLSETEVEIETKPGAVNSYELKFLAMGEDGSTSAFTVRDSSGTRVIKLGIIRENQSRNYSWFILAGGLVLLIAGLRLWRYQKSSPTMMSTKSLFMNYEELEKARKMYFDDSAGTSEAPVAKESVSSGRDNHATVKTDATPSSELPTSANDEVVTPEPETGTVEDLVITPDSTFEPSTANETAPRPGVSQKTAPRPGISQQRADSEKSASVELCIELCDESGRTTQGKGEVVKVGRRRDNQLILTGSEISREHLMFFRKSGGVWVKPLTTSNVTRLNGAELKAEKPITDGATINMGGTDFKVKIIV